MNVSFSPSYYCNFDCSFCYLTPKQRSDCLTCSPETYEHRLKEISQQCDIEQIDIYGGEVALLPPEKLDRFIDISLEYSESPVNIVTNLSMVNPSFLRKDITLAVSYDLHCREQTLRVLQNIDEIDRDVHILMLASNCLMEYNIGACVDLFNALPNVKTVEIKPYSSNQSNQLDIKFTDFEKLIKGWITCPIEKQFEFINELNIKLSIERTYSSWSDDHVFVTPASKLAILEFDEHGKEYFMELTSMLEYITWTTHENLKIVQNQFCGNCKYLGHCLSEHLQEIKTIDNSCNGFRGLLDWYADRS